MKIELKRSIVSFVKRILNYQEYADKYPFIVVEERKVVVIRNRYKYSNIDIKMMSKAQIKYAAGCNIMSELEKMNAIQYVNTPDLIDPEKTIIEATLKIVLP
jgi:hypothetical protein